MSERGATRPGSPSPADGDERIPPWLIALAAVAAVLVVGVLLVVVVPALRDRQASPESAGESAQQTTTTEAPQPSPAEMPLVAISGPIAYVRVDGRLMLGEGAAEPVELAADVAIGPGGLGAAAMAPTGDVVAYVRSDGALVSVPVPIGGVGGPPTVLAVDASLDAVGSGRSLAWDPTGTTIAYLADGTLEMVEPRSEEPPELSSATGVFRTPLPEGALGDVVKVIDRSGVVKVRLGDPSLRSMVGIASSFSDDLLLLESVAPDTGKPYTLALATTGTAELTPTLLSADDPTFAPDGSFVMAVGPDKRGQELLRLATDTLAKATITSSESICNPSVSPDSTRIVYAAGENCDRVEVVSSLGGTPIDITPPSGPGDTSFGISPLGWTQDGHHVVIAGCRRTDGPFDCSGTVVFLDPDRMEMTEGPVASTVAPLTRPLLQSVRLDLVMAGPLEYSVSYSISTELEGELTQLGDGNSQITAQLVEGDRSLGIDLRVREGAKFATGTLTIVDPAAGIDRTFLVLGEPSVLGIRILSLTGVWISTDEIPVISGEFRLALRRG